MNPLYSPLKILHHREWIYQISCEYQPFPIFIQLIPTNRCNQSCHHCSYRMEGYTSNEIFEAKDEIDFSKLMEIVENCKEMGVKAIELTGGGEPLLHPNFLDLIKEILNAEIEIGLVTNGSLWTDKHTDLLTHRKVKWIRFSIDAGCSPTYIAIRGTSTNTYKHVRESINELTSLTNRPVVGIGYVITKENYTEIRTAVYKAFEDGVDNIRLSAVFQNEGAKYFESFKDGVSRVISELQQEFKNQSFKIIDLFSDRVEDLEQGSPDYSFCGFQQASTYIGADYNVYRCCILAYSNRGILGSLRNQSFMNLWDSVEKRSKIRDFDAKQCPRCMFNAKNQLINYLLDDDPVHVNFV